MIWIYVLEADSITGDCATGKSKNSLPEMFGSILIGSCGRTNKIAEASYFSGIKGEEGDPISGKHGHNAQRANQVRVAAQYIEYGDYFHSFAKLPIATDFCIYTNSSHRSRPAAPAGN